MIRTLDFAVSGAGGFIGSHLVGLLRQSGARAEPAQLLKQNDVPVRYFVHCANIAHSPGANVALLRHSLSLAQRHRAEAFVQIQSFITLHGQGEIDVEAMNCGLRPRLLNPYALGKLFQEQVLLAESATPLRLVYLPAVIGEGGSWARVIAAAGRFGVAGLDEPSTEARPNFIEVNDLGQFLIRGALGVGAKSVQRFILSRPEAAELSWLQFLGGMTMPSQTCPLPARVSVQGSKTRAKEIAKEVAVRALGYGWQTGLLRPVSRPIPKPRRDHNSETGPVRFSGLVGHVVRTQPYIAART